MWVFYLTLYIFLSLHLAVFFFKAGRRIRISLLLYCVISSYNMIISRAMRIIWDVYSVLWDVYSATFTSGVTFVSPDYIQDYFPQLLTHFLSLMPVTTSVENFSFPLDVKESMSLLLGLPGPHHV